MKHINFSKLVTEKVIGVSSVDTVVYPYRKEKDDEKWAVKRIYVQDSEKLIEAINQIVCGFSCDHSAIVPIRSYDIVHLGSIGWSIYIKMPKFIGNLRDYIGKLQEQKVERLELKAIVQHFQQLVNGLKYLHDRKIAHKNIKHENILMDKEQNLRLSDVGSIAFNHKQNNSSEISNLKEVLSHIAPEIHEIDNPKGKDLLLADIWSLGKVFAELCLVNLDLIPKALLQEHKAIMIEVIVSEVRERYGNDIGDIIQGMLNLKPMERISSIKLSKF